MMATKQKTTEGESTTTATTSSPSSTLLGAAPSQESVTDLRNQLASMSTNTSNPQAQDQSQATGDTMAKKKNVVAAGGKNALLARVQAAQKRAKLQQERQKLLEKRKAIEEEERLLRELENEIEGVDNEDDDVKVASTTTKNVSTDFPPPSFDTFTRTTETTPTPTAPPVDFLSDDTTKPLEPPPPPSFQQFEQTQTPQENNITTNITNDNEALDDFAALDENGNPLSEEQRLAMMQEQERIMKQIQEEHAANQAAILAAQEEDRRVNAAAGAATDTSTNNHTNDNTDDNTSNIDIDAETTAETAQPTPSSQIQTVQIAPNKRVALHGQDRTRKAISDGTAVLVTCISCQNWMQVTPSATLMFCPICGSVSPVEHQSSVMTKEEAIRLSQDRRMAERLQNEEWKQGNNDEEDGDGAKDSGSGEEDGILASLEKRFRTSIFGGAAASGAETGVVSQAHARKPPPSSSSTSNNGWGSYLSSLVVGGTEDDEDEDSKPRSAEIKVTQGPIPEPRPLSSFSRNELELQEEEAGGDAHFGDERSSLLPAGRVADQKPLFSCVMDTVSNLVGTGAEGSEALPSEVHGIDSTGLLASVDGESSNSANANDGRGNYLPVV